MSQTGMERLNTLHMCPPSNHQPLEGGGRGHPCSTCRRVCKPVLSKEQGTSIKWHLPFPQLFVFLDACGDLYRKVRLFFWSCFEAYRLLASRSGMESLLRSLEAWSSNSWTAREAPRNVRLIFKINFYGSIVVLHFYVCFCCAAKWISYTCMYVLASVFLDFLSS